MIDVHDSGIILQFFGFNDKLAVSLNTVLASLNSVLVSLNTVLVSLNTVLISLITVLVSLIYTFVLALFTFENNVNLLHTFSDLFEVGK